MDRLNGCHQLFVYPVLYKYAVFTECLGTHQLKDAMDREVPCHVTTERGSGRDTHSMRTHNLQRIANP